MDRYARLHAVMAAENGVELCAPLVFGLLRGLGMEIRSVVDVGCGIGAWLAAARDVLGADVLGLDGAWTDPALLRLAPTCFRTADLEQPLELGRSFDLAVSVEVGEHLPARAAPVLVGSLVRHAPVIVFSAAIPSQGGISHVNEQWPDYWAALFEAHGFACHDVFRPVLWDRGDISWWYKQNLLLFVHEQRAAEAGIRLRLGPPERPRRLVHPDLFLVRCPRGETDILYENGSARSRFWEFDRQTGAPLREGGERAP
jgi:SAM-dependent methyltransferase